MFQSIKYTDKVLVLVGYKTNYAHLFTVSPNEKNGDDADSSNSSDSGTSYSMWKSLKLVQTISTRDNLRPVSAKFIPHKHELFLTIIYGNNQQAKAESV